RSYAGVLALSGDAERAEQVFREWTQSDPNSAPAWGGLGVVYAHRGKPEQAQTALRKAVELDDQDRDYKLWLGEALLDLEDNTEALAIFTKLTDEDADNEEAWLGRSKAERSIGSADWAIESARRGLEAGSFRKADGWIELGRSYSAADRHRNARDAFK